MPSTTTHYDSDREDSFLGEVQLLDSCNDELDDRSCSSLSMHGDDCLMGAYGNDAAVYDDRVFVFGFDRSFYPNDGNDHEEDDLSLDAGSVCSLSLDPANAKMFDEDHTRTSPRGVVEFVDNVTAPAKIILLKRRLEDLAVEQQQSGNSSHHYNRGDHDDRSCSSMSVDDEEEEEEIRDFRADFSTPSVQGAEKDQNKISHIAICPKEEAFKSSHPSICFSSWKLAARTTRGEGVTGYQASGCC